MTDAELEALIAGVSKSTKLAEAYANLENAAGLFIENVRANYPGEELHSPFVLFIDKALMELAKVKDKP
jgi:hypothetical protein